MCEVVVHQLLQWRWICQVAFQSRYTAEHAMSVSCCWTDIMNCWQRRHASSWQTTTSIIAGPVRGVHCPRWQIAISSARGTHCFHRLLNWLLNFQAHRLFFLFLRLIIKGLSARYLKSKRNFTKLWCSWLLRSEINWHGFDGRCMGKGLCAIYVATSVDVKKTLWPDNSGTIWRIWAN